MTALLRVLCLVPLLASAPLALADSEDGVSDDALQRTELLAVYDVDGDGRLSPAERTAMLEAQGRAPDDESARDADPWVDRRRDAYIIWGSPPVSTVGRGFWDSGRSPVHRRAYGGGTRAGLHRRWHQGHASHRRWRGSLHLRHHGGHRGGRRR